MRGTTIGALACVCGALSSCATVGEPPPSGPPPFLGVRTMALVRPKDDRGAARPKDPLDALAESLAARGLATRRIELGSGGPGAAKALERLFGVVDGRILAAAPRPRAGRADPLGADAAEAVRGAGVDAVAMYHRFDDRLLPTFQEPSAIGAFGQPRRPEPTFRRPAGALSLVDREGNATWFAWGGVGGGDLDADAAVNAAEAIDMLLRALAGEADEG